MKTAVGVIRSAACLGVVMLFSGCAAPLFDGKQILELRNAVNVKNETIAKREQEIRELMLQLERKDAELKARDAEVQALKEKLKNFGVF